MKKVKLFLGLMFGLAIIITAMTTVVSEKAKQVPQTLTAATTDMPGGMVTATAFTTTGDDAITPGSITTDNYVVIVAVDPTTITASKGSLGKGDALVVTDTGPMQFANISITNNMNEAIITTEVEMNNPCQITMLEENVSITTGEMIYGIMNDVGQMKGVAQISLLNSNNGSLCNSVNTTQDFMVKTNPTMGGLTSTVEKVAISSNVG